MTSKKLYKGSGIRTHNDSFEDCNFTTKLFLYFKRDLTSKENHLKRPKNLETRVVGSYNLYLIILGKKKDAKKEIKSHHK